MVLHAPKPAMNDFNSNLHEQPSKPLPSADMHPDKLYQYVREAKLAVIEELRRLLEHKVGISEREAWARSIGALADLERALERWRGRG